MKTHPFWSLVSGVILCLSLTSNAQDRYPAELGEPLWDGWDPVSFFQGRPLKGKVEFQQKIDGFSVLFASRENHKLFEDRPYRYIPAYGGWSCNAMAEGLFIVPDYNNFKIVGNQLLFFDVTHYYYGLERWNKNPVRSKIKADSVYRKYFE